MYTLAIILATKTGYQILFILLTTYNLRFILGRYCKIYK